MLYIKNDTDKNSEIIAALATPKGLSAVAVVRISGRGCGKIVEKMMKLKENRLRGKRRVVGIIYDREDKKIDEVVSISWPEGRSFTGEEIVEIITHGVPSLYKKILEECFYEGARQALSGEFTKRAFMNRKISGLEVMAMAELWDSDEINIVEKIGRIRSVENSVKENLKELEELIEAGIEFEDLHGIADTEFDIEKKIQIILEKIEKIKVIIKQISLTGRILIMGPRNSGKSSLFNNIVGKTRVLVSDVPGTTRDSVTEIINIESGKIEIVDNAGTGGVGLDEKAIKMAVDTIEKEDRIIWMSVGGKEDPPADIVKKAGEILILSSKCDIEKGKGLMVSVKTEQGLDEINKWIKRDQVIEERETGINEIKNIIEEGYRNLQTGENAVCSELVSEALEKLGEILDQGKGMETAVERALGRMCVGK